MKTKKAIERGTDDASKSPLSNLNNDRRDKEMKRRFGILQSRRGYLRHELKAVETGLRQLDQQIQSYLAYKQLLNTDKYLHSLKQTYKND